MKSAPVVLTVMLMTVLAGCGPKGARKGSLDAGREFLTVDFEKAGQKKVVDSFVERV